MNIKTINLSGLPLPEYKTEGSAGMDLLANINETIVLMPLQRILIKSGVAMEIPLGFEGQVRGRSGLALNYGIGIVNGIGTIDSDFRGEIGVMLINLGTAPFIISRGDRIAQLVISRVERVKLVDAIELTDSDRGSGGYGHTGI